MRRQVLLLTVLTAAALPAPAMANDFVVNTTADVAGSCSSTCTLRQAISDANASPGDDTIELLGQTVLLTIGGRDEDGNATGDLDLTQAGTTITINGDPAGGTMVLSAEGRDRVFDVKADVTLKLNRMTVGSGFATGAGGNILNDGVLAITDSAVTNGQSDDLGGAIMNNGTLTVTRSLIEGNSGFDGGAIANESEATIVDSTISGNTATDETGGIYNDINASVLDIESSTIVGNMTPSNGSASGILVGTGSGTKTIDNSIVSGNIGDTQCNGAWSSSTYSIDSTGSCNFLHQTGNQVADPLLGTLQDNGGPTPTYLPAAGSPAVDTGDPDHCPSIDQRGLARPALGGCDIGAVELQPPPPPPPPPPPDNPPTSITLDPATATHTPGDVNTVTATFKLKDGTPAIGLPLQWSVAGANPGTGSATTDVSGQAKITWDGVHDGGDTLTVYWDKSGNGAFDFGEPAATATVNWVLPPPVIAKTVNIEPVSGTVFVKLPAGSSKVGAAANGFIPLNEAKNVPIGTIVDATRGRMELTGAIKQGSTKTQSGQFYLGQFQMGQQKNSPYMDLTLNQALACTPAKVGAAAKKPKSRSLWGSDKGGKFRTRGRHSTATVRGTTWFTKDTCTTTTTVVREGTVTVRDLAKHRNVTVKAGHRYVAHAKKARKR